MTEEDLNNDRLIRYARGDGSLVFAWVRMIGIPPKPQPTGRLVTAEDARKLLPAGWTLHTDETGATALHATETPKPNPYEVLAETVWTRFYNDRRAWSALEEDTRKEWIRLAEAFVVAYNDNADAFEI